MTGADARAQVAFKSFGTLLLFDKDFLTNQLELSVRLTAVDSVLNALIQDVLEVNIGVVSFAVGACADDEHVDPL